MKKRIQKPINILYYIEYGHENGHTERDISRWAGVNQREVRRLISIARREEVILNMQDGKGYFRPDDTEQYLVKDWLNQEENRLKQHALALRAARKYVREE